MLLTCAPLEALTVLLFTIAVLSMSLPVPALLAVFLVSCDLACAVSVTCISMP